MANPVRLIAHRGASAAFPEHTRAAYLKAIEDGADGIETDIRFTRDRDLVCWHDATLQRTGGVRGRVRHASLPALRSLDLFAGQRIPAGYGSAEDQLMTLADLIDLMRAAGRPLLLAVELKPDPGAGIDLVDRTLAALDAAGWDPRTGRLGDLRITLMCFDVMCVRELRDRIAPELVMMLTDPEEPGAEEALDLIEKSPIGAGPGIAWVRAEPDRVAGWTARGTTVRVWTVDEPSDLEFCLSLGVREITTNTPRALRELLPALESAAAER